MYQAELTLKNDDAREIEVQSLKAAWEAAEPGRKQKAEVWTPPGNTI